MKGKISVLISVYKDKEEYFRAAIRSIQNQTYKNWEMIIVNDGDIENDGCYRKCIEELADKRIIYISNEKNQGISICLNQALQIATGEFIAKMDSDDISLPTRFEKQVKFFEAHPKSNVLGTSALVFGDINGYSIDYNNYSQKMRSILLLFRNSGLIHPSAMIRRSFLNKYNIAYDENFRKALDYRLWVECTKYSKIECLNDILFCYRRHSSQISTAGKTGQDEYRDQIRIMQLHNIVETVTESEKELHLRLCNRKNTLNDVQLLYIWSNRLIKSNREKGLYNCFLFKGFLYAESLTAVCKLRNELGTKQFFRNAYKFISIESVGVVVFNQYVNVYNRVKKKVFPKCKKREIQYINNYMRQVSKR